MAIGNVAGSFLQIFKKAEHHFSQNDKMHLFARIMLWNEYNYFINQRLINLLTTVSFDYDLISVRFQERKIHYLSVVHYAKKIQQITWDCIWKLTSFVCKSQETRSWESDVQSTHGMDPTTQTMIFLVAFLYNLGFYFSLISRFFMLFKKNKCLFWFFFVGFGQCSVLRTDQLTKLFLAKDFEKVKRWIISLLVFEIILIYQNKNIS